MSTPPTQNPPRRIHSKHIIRILVALIAAAAIIIAAVITAKMQSIPPTPTSSTLVPPSSATIPSQTPVNTPVFSPEQEYLHIINTLTPTLRDSLTAQDSNAWDTSSNSSTGCEFKNGVYHAFASQPNVVECPAKGVSFSNNFVYQVKVTTTQGDGGGIIFGSSVSNNSIKYRFYVNTGSYCDLFVPLNGGKRLFDSSQAPITSGSSLVAVMVISDTIYLFINKKYVGLAHTIDGNPLSGQIGLFAEEVKSTTNVVFGELNVWQI